jgi:hypothetical protein
MFFLSSGSGVFIEVNSGGGGWIFFSSIGGGSEISGVSPLPGIFKWNSPNTTFNNISAISWWSALLVEETGVPREYH